MQLAIDFFIQIFFYKIRQDAKNINYNQNIERNKEKKRKQCKKTINAYRMHAVVIFFAILFKLIKTSSIKT